LFVPGKTLVGLMARSPRSGRLEHRKSALADLRTKHADLG
jgi:hypothetical protein